MDDKEENKAVELKDPQLKQVSGGNSSPYRDNNSFMDKQFCSDNCLGVLKTVCPIYPCPHGYK